MRGFAAEVGTGSGGQSPLAQQEKIAIPMQVKRKAQGELPGQSGAKK